VHLALSGRPDAASYVRTGAGVGSVVRKVTMTDSFVVRLIRLSVCLSSTAMGVVGHAAWMALRRVSDGRRGAFYAGSCIWTSENTPSTHSGE
jgi:hypothetical protein